MKVAMWPNVSRSERWSRAWAGRVGGPRIRRAAIVLRDPARLLTGGSAETSYCTLW